ncbi:MAG: hypothetical protein M5U13_17815 [Thermoanaerobaculia bacterium]|nr:hypothetical protein [Thermoanaerobaculia bacterium]
MDLVDLAEGVEEDLGDRELARAEVDLVEGPARELLGGEAGRVAEETGDGVGDQEGSELIGEIEIELVERLSEMGILCLCHATDLALRV